MLKNPQALKDQFSKVQEEIKKIEETGSAGGGIVKVTMNGEFEILKVDLNPIAVDPRDIQMLQDLIVAASHDASSKIKASLENRVGLGRNGIDFSAFGIH